jgi:hypothetical protein
MAIWKEEVNLSHLHRLYEGGKINVEQLGKGVAGRLRGTELSKKELELADIITEFCALDRLSELKDYEQILDMLYVFGDRDHRLWVETYDMASKKEEDETEIMGSSTYHHNPTAPIHTGIYTKGCNNDNNWTPYSSGSGGCGSSRRSRKGDTYSNYNTTYSEMEEKLRLRKIEKDRVPHDLFDYLRKVPSDYQEWLLDRVASSSIREITKENNDV